MSEKISVFDDASISIFKNLKIYIEDEFRASDFPCADREIVEFNSMLYAAVNYEIANALFRPVEEVGKVDKHLSEVSRWSIAITFAQCGKWEAMSEELQIEANQLVTNASAPKDVELGYALSEMATRLSNP